jgi:hypothetical protein
MGLISGASDALADAADVAPASGGVLEAPVVVAIVVLVAGSS